MPGREFVKVRKVINKGGAEVSRDIWTSGELTLVILAAGRGSRYGGPKQLAAIGPRGETFMDYAIYDARRAGFDRVVLVVSAENRGACAESLGSRIGSAIPLSYVIQRLDDLPEDQSVPEVRAKPWGTGHAVLAVRDAVRGPFALVNADDFYGAEAYTVLAEFLRDLRPAAAAAGPGAVPTFGLVGYTLRDTLSARGPVSKAVCQCGPDGWLEKIVEILELHKRGKDGYFFDAEGQEQTVDGGELVSTNFFGFTPEIFPLLEAGLRRFLTGTPDLANDEFLLPALIGEAITSRQACVEVLPGGTGWMGVTYRGDRTLVAAGIERLIERGDYPQDLWNRG